MEKYFTYEVQDFLDDAVFVQWVKSDFVLNNDVFQKIQNHSPLLKRHISDASALIKSLHHEQKKISQEQINSLWNKIESTIDVSSSGPQVAPKRTAIRLLPWLAAASLLLLLWMNWQHSKTNISPLAIVTNTQHQQIKLPDQSLVEVDAHSKLSYENSFSENRVIRLNGRAHFNVKKGSTFKVETDKGTVTVLGTSFTVDSRNDQFNVYCEEGKVSVEIKGGGSRSIITAMQSVSIENKILVVKNMKNENPLLWKAGSFYFSDADLSMVFKELENQFDIKVECSESIRMQKYTGYFTLGNVDQAMQAITWPMKLTYTKKNSQTFIIHN